MGRTHPMGPSPDRRRRLLPSPPVPSPPAGLSFHRCRLCLHQRAPPPPPAELNPDRRHRHLQARAPTGAAFFRSNGRRHHLRASTPTGATACSFHCRHHNLLWDRDSVAGILCSKGRRRCLQPRLDREWFNRHPVFRIGP
jgi:hypothetical protein